MKRKWISIMLSAALTVGVLGGCGSTDAKNDTGKSEQKEAVNDTLTMAINTIPEKLWSDGTGASFNVISRPIYDLLAFPTAKGYDYYLVDNIEISEDYKNFKFHLREDAVWSDGVPITTKDVEFTMKYYIDVKKKSEKSFGTLNIVDDKNFEITIEETSLKFLPTLLPYFTLMPEHPFEGDPTKVDPSGYFLKAGMATSGPYKVVEINEDNVILEAREDYYGGIPEAKQLIQKVIPTTAAQQVAFDNGELSYFEATTAQILEKYSDKEKYNIEVLNDTRLNYLHLNPELPKEAREAISLALNCQEIVNIVYGSDKLATPANSPLTPYQAPYNKECGYKQNIEKAKTLAKNSGLTEKKLTYLYNSDRVNMEEIGTVVQQQLAAIGVDVQLEGVDNASFFTRYWADLYKNPDAEAWDLCTNGVTFMSGDGMASWGNWAAIPGYNFQFSQELIDKIATANATIPVEKANEMMYDIQEEMLENYTVYPISYSNFVMVTQKNVSGLDSAYPYSGVGDFSKIKMN